MKISVIIPVYNNEKFLLEAMESVKSQDVDEVELIVVNDGSSDGSEKVARDFAAENDFVRVISQENSGVYAARNAGLDAATGEYIGFLDSDDIYRPYALSSMLAVAGYWDSDLVIGESRSVGTFATSLLAQGRELSRTTILEKNNYNFIYNFSVCNKIFKRSLIEENHLRFQPIKHAEDGLFLFSFLNVAEKINGCPRYMYEYRKRIILDSQSTLKSLDKSHLDSAITAARSIEALTSDYSEEFRHHLDRRILRITLMNEYYRRLWTLADDAYQELTELIASYRERVGEETWQEINGITEDLEMAGGIRSKEEIAADPLISVIIPFGLTGEELLDVIRTLYFQLCPNFEVIVDQRYRGMVPGEYESLLNFRYAEDEAGDWASLIRASRGRTIQFVAEPCIYAENSLQMMQRRLRESEKDFISILPKYYEAGQTFPIENLEQTFFLPKKPNKAVKKAAKKIDSLWCNKLFNRDAVMKLLEAAEEAKAAAEAAKAVAEEAAAEAADTEAPSTGKKASPAVSFNMKSAYKLLSFRRFGRNYIGITHPEDLPGHNMEIPQKAPAKKEAADDSIEKMRRRVYKAARLLPVNKKKVLFLSDIRGKIGGNYLPLYQPLVDAGFQVICDFKKDKNTNEGRRRKLERAFHLATAAYIVLEDFHTDSVWIDLRKGQHLVQLWHAAGAYKKFAFSRAKGPEKINISPGYRKITDAIVSSEGIRHNYAEAYDIDVSKVLATGLPRTDIFFDREYMAGIRQRYEEKYPALKGKKILLVSPTYRGTSLDNATYAYDKLDPARMHEVLGDDWVIVFKWHPAAYNVLKKQKKKAYDYKKYAPYAMDLSKERDVNDLLILADMVITDYSSIIFEYELMNKPVIYYWYDVNDYLIDRGMYYDLPEYVYGSVCYDFEQLLAALAEPDMGAEKRAAFHKKFMEGCDGHATEKVVREIFRR